jgi:hypothetical protein
VKTEINKLTSKKSVQVMDVIIAAYPDEDWDMFRPGRPVHALSERLNPRQRAFGYVDGYDYGSGRKCAYGYRPSSPRRVVNSWESLWSYRIRLPDKRSERCIDADVLDESFGSLSESERFHSENMSRLGIWV